MGGQAGRHLLEPGAGLQTVLLCGGEQTHDRGSTLPGVRRTGFSRDEKRWANASRRS